MVVRNGDNPRALTSRLSPVQADKHGSSCVFSTHVIILLKKRELVAVTIVFPSCLCLCILCAGLDNSVRGGGGGGSSYFVSLTCFSEGRMDLPRVVSSKWTRAVQLLLDGDPG